MADDDDGEAEEGPVETTSDEPNPMKNLIIGGVGFVALLILINIVSPTFARVVVNNIPYLILLALFSFGFTKVFVRMYGATDRGVIYRFGKFNRVAGPGWSIVIPFFEKEFQKVDVRTHTEIINEVGAVTRDDIPLSFDVSFFYSIADPKKAALQVTAVHNSVRTFFQGLIRDGTGNFVMREVFNNMTDISAAMKDRAIPVLEQWGILISDIEILKVTLPDTLMTALYQPVTEEQRALAARFQAEATRVTTEVLGDAAQRLNPNALTYLYLKALQATASAPNSKVVLPMSFGNVMNSLTSGIGLGVGLQGMDEQNVVNQIAQKISGK